MSSLTIEKFERDIANHKMTIVRDDGVARHIRFAVPGTGCMHFDLITWPGYLCYTGDMGTYVFRRLTDMFEFFRRSDKSYSIDMCYWAEKCEASDKGDGVKKYSPEKFKARIAEWIDDDEENCKPDPDDVDGDDLASSDPVITHSAAYAELRKAVRDEVLSLADDGDIRAYDAAISFQHEGDAWQAFHGEKASFCFSDFWEVDCTEFTHRFQWCCLALAWGIEVYDATKEETAVPA